MVFKSLQRVLAICVPALSAVVFAVPSAQAVIVNATMTGIVDSNASFPAGEAFGFGTPLVPPNTPFTATFRIDTSIAPTCGDPLELRCLHSFPTAPQANWVDLVGITINGTTVSGVQPNLPTTLSHEQIVNITDSATGPPFNEDDLIMIDRLKSTDGSRFYQFNWDFRLRDFPVDFLSGGLLTDPIDYAADPPPGPSAFAVTTNVIDCFSGVEATGCVGGNNNGTTVQRFNVVGMISTFQMSVEANAVSEPGAFAIFGLGLVGFGLFRRTKSVGGLA